MVKDLNLNIDVIAGETIRETDNLAMSSRNQYLNQQQHIIAVQLKQQLNHVAQAIRDGNNNFSSLTKKAMEALNQAGFSIDYFEICHQQSLQPAIPRDPLVILVAARLGSTRLIDNIEI